MNQRVLILIACYFSYLCSLSAQVGFSIPHINNATNGSIIDIPVSVSNFDSIVSAQFVIRWDPAVIRFESVDQFNLPDLTETKFGTSEAVDSGFVRFAWYYFTGAGTTVSNGTAIFHLKFKVIGPINSGTPIVFTQLPPITYFEIVKANGIVYESPNASSIKFGFVAVGYAVGTNNLQHNLPIDIFPNPFSEKTSVSFTLKEASNLDIKIVDIAGKILFENNRYFSVGVNGMEIDCNILNKKGIYFILIQSEKVSHVERLIFIE